ncbi:MAG: glucose-6-phosphate isomerase [Alphaproteobacteria bacterium]
MLYRHETRLCFAKNIGDDGLSADEFDPVLEATAPILADLCRQHADGAQAFLKLPGRTDDLDGLHALARRYRGSFDDVVVLGTGGSSLGGQALAALGATNGDTSPRLHFMDNIDPASFAVLFAGLDLARTGWIVISKSGTTPETVAQFLICLKLFSDVVGIGEAAAQFVVITAPDDGNPLRRTAERNSIPVVDFDPGVDGRFSALSAVGLLPAMIAGLDGGAVRQGAKEVLDAVMADATPAAAAAQGAAINVALSQHHHISQTVLMPYADRLKLFAGWHRQLWAESLGKDGCGTTPINAQGAVDQHSQLQLYLAGPRDKLFNFILTDAAGSGQTIVADFTEMPEFAYLKGHSMGDLLAAEQAATAETLANSGHPVRMFAVATVNEGVIGALMMHFMLETVIAAGLYGVDPFGQPAVEEGKVLARSYLAELGTAGAKAKAKAKGK